MWVLTDFEVVVVITYYFSTSLVERPKATHASYHQVNQSYRLKYFPFPTLYLYP